MDAHILCTILPVHECMKFFYIDLRKAFDTITCVLFCDTLFQEEKKLK